MSAPLVALVVVGALALSVGGGWPVVSLVLRLASRSSDAGRPRQATRHAHAADPAGTGAATTGPAATPEAAPAAPDGSTPSPLAVSDGPEGEGARAVLRGGTWVGILERLAVTGCLLLGDVGGIAVIVAVKGLGRYPELRENPGASERFVIGTLASLVWAAGVGYGAAALLG